MSQGHNALPRPGLEPGSSDSEPSALTTGPLDHWTTGPLDHWTTGQLYGRTSKFFRLDGLLLFCIIMGLHSASSTINTHTIYLFLFSCHHIPTNRIALISAYKYTHNSQFLQLLWWRAIALKMSDFKLYKVGNFHYQLSQLYQITLLYSPTDAAPQFL